MSIICINEDKLNVPDYVMFTLDKAKIWGYNKAIEDFSRGSVKVDEEKIRKLVREKVLLAEQNVSDRPFPGSFMCSSIVKEIMTMLKGK